MTDRPATDELTRLKAVADYVMDIWPDAVGFDSMGGNLQMVMGDGGWLMGENIVIGNAKISGPDGKARQEFGNVGKVRMETVELSVVISVRKKGASAREVFNRINEIGDRITAVQRTDPHDHLGTFKGVALAPGGAGLTPLLYEHLLLSAEDPKDTKAPKNIRGGRLSCVLVAKGIRF